jgi:hypothetical protein
MFSTHRNAVADTPNPWKVPTNMDALESVKRRPSRGGFVLGVLASAALVATSRHRLIGVGIDDTGVEVGTGERIGVTGHGAADL